VRVIGVVQRSEQEPQGLAQGPGVRVGLGR
jgi:hypothetical protein